MSNTLIVRQGGGAADEVDYAETSGLTNRKGAAFFTGNTPTLQMGQRFADGESAMGSFLLSDPNADLSDTDFKIKPHCEVRLTEDASGDEYTIAWMRISGIDGGRRGPYIGGDELEHTVRLMDCNLDLRGIPFEGGWSRPAENDMQRLSALQAAKLAGAGSTAPIHRATTTITVDRFTNDHLVQSDNLDLPAKDYPEGTTVEEIIGDIATQAGKTWGVVLHHDGGSTHRCLLYIDLDDVSSWTSGVKISDNVDDWAPNHASTPVFEPHWMQGAAREADGDFVVTGLISVYGGLDDAPRTLTVETGDAPEDAEVWWDVYNDAENHTLDPATRAANSILDSRRLPHTSHRPSILVKPSQLHLVTAGQSIQVKGAALSPGVDKHSYIWRRVAECKVEPAADGLWWMHLSLERPRLGRGPSGGGGQPGSTSPKPAPEQNPNPGDTVVKFYNANDAGGDDILWDGILGNQGGSPGDGANGTSFYYFKSTAPDRRQESWAATAGATYRISGYINSASSGIMDFGFSTDAAGTDNPSTTTILASYDVTPAQPNSGNSFSLFSAGPFTAPVGTVSAALGRHGGSISFDEVSIYLVGDPTENDEHAVDYDGYPHSSPFYLPSDYVEARLDEIPEVLNDLADVDTETTEPEDGWVLAWDDTAQQWVPIAGSGDHGGLSGLTDDDHPQYVTTTLGGRDVVNVVTAAGSTETLDLTTANFHDVTLTANCTLTLSGATNGVACYMEILLRQGSGAPWTVTWPGSVEWVGGSAPTLETAVDAWNLIALVTDDGGTTWFADAGGTGTGSGSVATDTIWDAKGDLAVGTGSNTASKLTAGADDTVLMADSAAGTGLKWVASQTPSTQAFGDAAAQGSADTYARGDHKHGMPSSPPSGAPDSADYLVGTANGSLTSEIVVGTTPGGELGGTWASPTVDATHSGSAHHTEDHDHDGSPTQKLAQANTHESPDTDSGSSSLHHTIGGSSTQAAAGNHTHGIGIAYTELVQTADETVTNSATPTASTYLTFSATASSVYEIEFAILYSGNNATGDFYGEFSYPTLSLARQASGWWMILGASDTPNQFNGVGTTTKWPASAINMGTDASDTIFGSHGTFTLVTNGSGTVSFNFCNASASTGRTSTLRSGSYLRYRKLR